MLSKIRIHTTVNKKLWFNLTDIANILKVRVSSLKARKNVTAKLFKVKGELKLLYVDEKSFRALFQNDNSILQELDDYRCLGKKNEPVNYSEVLTVALFIAYTGADMDGFVHLPGNKPIAKADLKHVAQYPPVAKALLGLYTEAVFYDPVDEDCASTRVLVSTIFQNIPIKLSIEKLYEVYSGQTVPELVNELRLAKSGSAVGLCKALLSRLSVNEVQRVCEAICSRLIAKQDGKVFEPRYNWYSYPFVAGH
jgi:hypothetical protein